MPNRTLFTLFSCALITFSSTPCAQGGPPKSCAYDRARLLALNESQFDQDMAGGWRALVSRPGCGLVAADLLHDYREANADASGLLFWHEAQIRAEAGQYPQAITLMKRAYKPVDKDNAGWNPYVDATIAFLRRDRAALQQAQTKLAAVQPPVRAGIPPVINGYMEVDMDDGSKANIRWPPNIDVVEGLVNCFGKPYNEAYTDVCRQSKP